MSLLLVIVPIFLQTPSPPTQKNTQTKKKDWMSKAPSLLFQKYFLFLQQHLLLLPTNEIKQQEPLTTLKSQMPFFSCIPFLCVCGYEYYDKNTLHLFTHSRIIPNPFASLPYSLHHSLLFSQPCPKRYPLFVTSPI